MFAFDWSKCPAVESVPDSVGGTCVLKGTSLPVATLIENLEDLSVDEVMVQFDVTRGQVGQQADRIAGATPSATLGSHAEVENVNLAEIPAGSSFT